MNLDKKDQSGNEQNYYDRLSNLFEKVAWATILWALLVNILSPYDQTTKVYTGLVILIASVFNFIYFRYIYFFIKKAEFRFYVPETIFPFFIWIFIHLHHEFTAFFLLPYYILLLATSLTLKKIDVLLALVASLLFVIIETIFLQTPMGSGQRALGASQVAALLVFSWVALKLAEQVKIQRGETGNVLKEVIQEEEKSNMLKEFTSQLVIDRQKAQILLDESPLPLLVADNKSRILETNDYFEELSDFKNNSLINKDISFVLKLGNPLNFNGKSYLPEEFAGTLLTRRGKEKRVSGRAHYLLGRDRRLKQILILINEVA